MCESAIGVRMPPLACFAAKSAFDRDRVSETFRDIDAHDASVERGESPRGSSDADTSIGVRLGIPWVEGLRARTRRRLLDGLADRGLVLLGRTADGYFLWERPCRRP